MALVLSCFSSPATTATWPLWATLYPQLVENCITTEVTRSVYVHVHVCCRQTIVESCACKCTPRLCLYCSEGWGGSVGGGRRWRKREGEYAGRLEEMEGVGWGGGGKREKWTEGLIVEFIMR